MSKSGNIKNEIISAIGITTISYNDLIDTIVRMYGKESNDDKDQEDGVMKLSGENVQGILNDLLNPDITTLANFITNCPEAMKSLKCIYKTGEGMVYIVER